jgi:hypothetical protein
MATAARLLAHAGYELVAQARIEFSERPGARGRSVWVPDHLPRLKINEAFARVRLPLHLNWPAPERVFDLASRADRARVYEVVLRVLQDARPANILT